MAKAVGEWDVDKLEKEMPVCAIREWNEYLNYELSVLTKAVMSVLPTARVMSESETSAVKLTDPEQIAGFFDAMNKRD